MQFGLLDVLQILGSLCFFMYGMKLMSDGIQRAAGSQMRNILRSMTKNRFLGIFTGILITSLVQSSSATTVMTVSFVNAGLLTLFESAGVLMGANIGTTITGWIVSLLGFKIKLSAYSIPLFAIAIPILLSNRGRIKYWGEFLLGFAILFMGLDFLKESLPDLKNNTGALNWLTDFSNYGFVSRVVFVLVGTVITIVVQSSSAAMAITLTMVAQGWLPLEIAAAMVLGENIGTTITAELAALVGNVSAKRAARIHSLFNIFGVVWMVVLLPFVLPLVKDAVFFIFKSNDNALRLAAFHTVFNVANVILLFGFVPYLANVAVWSVRAKPGDEDDEVRLKFLGASVRTAELSTVELQNEAAHFGGIIARMSGFTRELVNTTESKTLKRLHKKISKYEEISDRMEVEITEYITNLAGQELTQKTSMRLRSVINICNDLERIADIYFQISKSIELKNEERAYFTPTQRENINKMCDKIDHAFEIMVENLNTPSYDDVTKDAALAAEKEIDLFRNELRKQHLTGIGDPGYKVRSAMIYSNVFQSLEKVGDHIINVSESVVGEI